MILKDKLIQQKCQRRAPEHYIEKLNYVRVKERTQNVVTGKKEVEKCGG